MLMLMLIVCDSVILRPHCLLYCSWRDWAATRFVHHWGAFLAIPEAVADPQFGVVKKSYEAVTKRSV